MLVDLQTSLREKCLNFILQNFDSVTKTATFEEMGRTNMDLVFEILKKVSHLDRREPEVV